MSVCGDGWSSVCSERWSSVCSESWSSVCGEVGCLSAVSVGCLPAVIVGLLSAVRVGLLSTVVVNPNHIQNPFTCYQILMYVSQIILGSDDHHVVCIKSYPRAKDTTMWQVFEWYEVSSKTK